VIAIATLLLALPLGLWCRSRLVAHTAYALAYLWCFVYQTLYLLLDSLDPDATAPAFTAGEFPLSYGVVTLLVLAVGFCLVEGGHRWGARRRSGRVAAVPA
jgi:hypothetical protein